MKGSLHERSALDNTIYKFLRNGGTIRGLLQNLRCDGSLLSSQELELLCRGDALINNPTALGEWADIVLTECEFRMDTASAIIHKKYERPLKHMLALKHFVEGITSGKIVSASTKEELTVVRTELNQARYNTRFGEALRQTTMKVCKATWWFCMLRCNATDCTTDLGDLFVEMDLWNDAIASTIDCFRVENLDEAIQDIDAFLSLIT